MRLPAERARSDLPLNNAALRGNPVRADATCVHARQPPPPAHLLSCPDTARR
ncbi:hypothetical protein XCR_3034 [Xanthomonas campestris pv. raphani 756C]|nr:hypothetical protein XCR_3034 [Xanthomonas campestris pv. raphani 756C]